MKNIRFVIMVPCAAIALASCTGGDTSSTTSSIDSMMSEASSSVMSATSTAGTMNAEPSNTMQQDSTDISVEVDGNPVQGQFGPVTCVQESSDSVEVLSIESVNDGPFELDVDISTPEEMPMLRGLDLNTDTMELETDDQQETSAILQRAENIWTVETDARNEGTGDMVRVKIQVACPQQ